MRETITTCGELVGAALISTGAWRYSSSLGMVVAGTLLIVICVLAGLNQTVASRDDDSAATQ